MEFAKTLGRLVGITHQLFLKNLDKAFKREGLPLTAEQFKMMSRLWDQDGISQNELAEGIGRQRAATGRMIDTIEQKGLVKRESHPTDRRQKLVYLTKHGKEMKGVAEKCAKRVLDQSVDGLSEDNINMLRILINKIIRNLE